MQDLSLPVLAGTTDDPTSAVESYQCDRCGLCCKHLIVEADWADVLREPRIARECPNMGASKVPLLEQTWMLHSKAKNGACPFLGDDHHCGIYSTRPGTCVMFVAGSPKCQDLRTAAGLPALVPVSDRTDDVADRISAAVIEYEREES